MPLTDKGAKILKAMREQYGKKRGTSVFYASINKGKVKGAEKEAALREAYRRGFEKGAQEAAPLFGTNDTAQLEDREGFGKRRSPGMLYYDKDPTTKEYTVPTLPFGLQIPTNDAPRKAAVSNSLVRAGTPAASVPEIFEGRAPVNRAHMRSAVVDSLNNEFAPRAAGRIPNWSSLPRDIQQRVARDIYYPGASSPKAIGHLGTNGFAQAADEFELNDFPPKTKQYVSELAARLRTQAANTARPAPVVSPQAPAAPSPAVWPTRETAIAENQAQQAALIEQIQRLRASRNKR